MGSTFRFHCSPRPAPAAAAAAAPRTRAVAGGGKGAPMLHVLLAEDHATNQYLINAYLRGAGHVVTVVDNGREAVAAAARGGFDVILMDVQMPEIDGLAADPGDPGARRSEPARVPIIALTANAMPEDRRGCFEAGMTDYLAKPVDVAALHAALHRARADRGEAERGPAVGRLARRGTGHGRRGGP